MQNSKCKIILESIVKLVNLRSLRICTTKFLNSLHLLLPGIVFDTYACVRAHLLVVRVSFSIPMRAEEGKVLIQDLFSLVRWVSFSIPTSEKGVRH